MTEDSIKEALKGVEYDSLEFIPDFEEVDGEVFPSYEIILHCGKDTLSCLCLRAYLEKNLAGFARCVKRAIEKRRFYASKN